MQIRHRHCGWRVVVAGIVLMVGMTATAHAAVQLDRTRVIVSQKDSKQSIRASNRGKTPVLLQIWMEEGEAANASTAKNRTAGLEMAASVAAQAVPFIIDPPVVQLKPDETRALQVWLTRPPETLPKDRESQFWLNVLEVPAVQSTEAEQGNRLDISIVTRIKVFYRPETVVGHKWSEDDWLKFSLETDEQNQHWLIIHNPAPIHRTLYKVKLYQDGEEPVELRDISMITPFGKQKVKFQRTLKTKDARLLVTSFNDKGKIVQTRHDL